MLDAVAHKGGGPGIALVTRVAGRSYVNPTSSWRAEPPCGSRSRNRLAEPTVIHWHGLAVDTANDGNGETLIARVPRSTMRSRSAIVPASIGTIRTRTARRRRSCTADCSASSSWKTTRISRFAARCDLTPGETEIPLVLHDRRRDAPNRYAPTPGDLVHGWYGDESLVNFTARPHLDVASGRYRFRVLNAANARIYRLGSAERRGTRVPFHLIGTDGGLLGLRKGSTKCSSRRPSVSTSSSIFPGCRIGELRAPRKSCLRSDAWRARRGAVGRRGRRGAARARASGRRRRSRACPARATARRTRCCNSGCGERARRSQRRCRSVYRRRQRWPRRPETIVRCGSDSPRAAGESTIASTT